MISLIERLHKYKDNRGIMSSLRCILVENKKHRAWPALNRLGVKITDDVAAFIAGLYATHSEDISEGNFGATCKIIANNQRQREGEVSDSENDTKLSTIERRFLHLLSAERGNELFGRVMRMVLMAQSHNIAINYEKLMIDIKYWNDRTKTEWAAAFWAPHIEAKFMGKEEV